MHPYIYTAFININKRTQNSCTNESVNVGKLPRGLLISYENVSKLLNIKDLLVVTTLTQANNDK